MTTKRKFYFHTRFSSHQYTKWEYSLIGIDIVFIPSSDFLVRKIYFDTCGFSVLEIFCKFEYIFWKFHLNLEHFLSKSRHKFKRNLSTSFSIFGWTEIVFFFETVSQWKQCVLHTFSSHLVHSLSLSRSSFSRRFSQMFLLWISVIFHSCPYVVSFNLLQCMRNIWKLGAYWVCFTTK